MDEHNEIERLKIPLVQLSIEIHLRRRLINAGYDSLDKIVLADESTLENQLESSDFDECLKIREAIDEDCSSFLEKNLKGDSKKQPAEFVASKQKESHVGNGSTGNSRRVFSSPSRSTMPRASYAIAPIPNLPFFEKLSEIEERAKLAMSHLDDHAIVAGIFPSLIDVLDDMRLSFKKLFERYQSNSARALDITKYYYPNSVIVFVAYFASNNFDGDSFWEKMFEYLSIKNQSVQTDMKHFFYSGIQDRGFPLYSPDECDFHYLYTALLHGGFSEAFWKPMWKDVIFQHVKQNSISQLSRKNGAELLSDIKQGSGSYALGKTYAKRIIEKAPSSTLVPLLESALQVALDIEEDNQLPSNDTSSFEMLSSHGLPDAAMRALREILEDRASGKTKRFVYLPMAELRIDPAAGRVHLHWDAQKLPCSFAGRVIEYKVNGMLVGDNSFNMGVGSCILSEKDISVDLNNRFDVELVLIDSDENRTRLASLNQTFDRTRPGSFEFIEGSDGIYRLRKRRERITKPKNIAFLTKADLWVEPDLGMESKGSYDAEEQWCGASIQIFEVKPGSSGSIVNLTTGETIACWSEDYHVEVDRSHVIGKGFGKRDLYGFSETGLGGNSQLPEISVETNDASSIREDLDIKCICDKQRYSLPWKPVVDIIDHEEQNSGRLIIKIAEAFGLPFFVEKGSVVVIQKTTGQKILDYKFSIIPIRAFGIEKLAWHDNVPYATYAFEAVEAVDVFDKSDVNEMTRGNRYCFDAPLSLERKSITFGSKVDDKKLDVCMNLAGIELSLSQSLTEINKIRPICLFDLAQLDGLLTITTKGRRQGRAALAMIGFQPLFYKLMKSESKYEINIFENSEALKSRNGEERRDVVFILKYGEKNNGESFTDAPAELTVLKCVTGAGLGKPSLINKGGVSCISFSNDASVDIQINFKQIGRRGDGALFGTSVLAAGDSIVEIPSDAVYQLDIRKTLVVTLAPIDLFGNPDENFLTSFEIRR